MFIRCHHCKAHEHVEAGLHSAIGEKRQQIETLEKLNDDLLNLNEALCDVVEKSETEIKCYVIKDQLQNRIYKGPLSIVFEYLDLNKSIL